MSNLSINFFLSPYAIVLYYKIASVGSRSIEFLKYLKLVLFLVFFTSSKQEALKGSPDHNTQSPEVSSKSVARTEGLNESPLKTEDVNDSLKILTGRLSAALVNVSAKEDLVKQHAKVAEEAVAGNVYCHCLVI